MEAKGRTNKNPHPPVLHYSVPCPSSCGRFPCQPLFPSYKTSNSDFFSLKFNKHQPGQQQQQKDGPFLENSEPSLPLLHLSAPQPNFPFLDQSEAISSSCRLIIEGRGLVGSGAWLGLDGAAFGKKIGGEQWGSRKEGRRKGDWILDRIGWPEKGEIGTRTGQVGTSEKKEKQKFFFLFFFFYSGWIFLFIYQLWTEMRQNWQMTLWNFPSENLKFHENN